MKDESEIIWNKFFVFFCLKFWWKYFVGYKWWIVSNISSLLTKEKFWPTNFSSIRLKKKAKIKNFKSRTISTTNDLLASCSEVILVDIENYQPDDKGRKCHVCIKILRGMEDKERCPQKGNLTKMKKKFKNYKKPTCLNYCSKKVQSCILCERCSPLLT